MMAKYQYPYPYISEVRLTNFKSVVKKTGVRLAPLTLLVGENSSGKSSILQVLRLLQQNLFEGNIVPLNSESLHLGAIDDIRAKNASHHRDVVTFGMEITDGKDTIDWDIKIRNRVPGELGSAYIHGLQIKCVNSEQSSPLLDVRIKRPRSTSKGKRISTPLYSMFYDDSYDDNRFSYRFRGIMETDTGLKGKIVGKSSFQVSGWVSETIESRSRWLSLPWSVTIKKPANEVLTKVVLDYLIRITEIRLRREEEDHKSDSGDDKKREKKDSSMLVNNKKILVDWAVKYIEEFLNNRSDVDSLEPWSNNPYWAWHSMPTILGKVLLQEIKSNNLLRGEIVKEISEKLRIPDKEIDVVFNISDVFISDDVAPKPPIGASKPPLGRRIAPKPPLGRRIEDIMDRIKYLGPLREEPQLVTTNRHPSSDDIGTKGELMAAVLYRHERGDQKLVLPVPDKKEMENVKLEKVKLMEAVTRWVKRIKLVKEVDTADEGIRGRSLKVKPYGVDEWLPLWSVGVGVSQLLPVLVLCLLAKPGDIILLEQPELHLHPAMQQRLADFFIEISRFGRQLIVETHSEYIISRLRRRVVEEEADDKLEEEADNKLTELVKVIFAEREGGETKYSELKLTQYGDIEKWPEGFFDQAAKDEREIIRAALKVLKIQKAQKSSDSPGDG